MKDLFVNYNQALELKELGFDEPCFAKYYQQDGNTPFIQIGEAEIEEAENGGDDITFECNAPLFQQAFRFFREKYDITQTVARDGSLAKEGPWAYTIVSDYIFFNDGYLSYEEAESACLDKLIRESNKPE